MNSEVLGVPLCEGTAINKIRVSSPVITRRARSYPLSRDGDRRSGFQMTGRPLSGLTAGLVGWPHTGHQS